MVRADRAKPTWDMIKSMRLGQEAEEAFKRKVTFDCVSDGVEAFRLCQELGLDTMVPQIVDRCCDMDFDPSWPPELIDKVIRRLKEKAEARDRTARRVSWGVPLGHLGGAARGRGSTTSHPTYRPLDLSAEWGE